MDLGADSFSHNHAIDVFGVGKPESVAVNVVVHAEYGCGHVKRAQFLVENAMVGQIAVPNGVGVLFGIVAVNRVYICFHL